MFGDGFAVLVLAAVKMEVHFPVQCHQKLLSRLAVEECGEVKCVSVRDGAGVIVVECGFVAEFC